MEIRLHGFQKRKRGFCKLEMKPDLIMGKLLPLNLEHLMDPSSGSF